MRPVQEAVYRYRCDFLSVSVNLRWVSSILHRAGKFLLYKPAWFACERFESMFLLSRRGQNEEKSCRPVHMAARTAGSR